MTDALDETATFARERIKALPDVPPATIAVEIALTPVEDLRIHPAYQRKISQGGMSKITKIIRDFTWARFGALSVARAEDGTLWVVDGQHRMIAARALRLTHVPTVIAASDLADQARDFVGINTIRTSVASIDKFRARVASGDQTAIAVSELLGTLEISTEVAAGAAIGPKETRAVALLEKLVARYGSGTVGDAIEIMLDAQPGQSNLLTAFAIEVVTTVYAKMIEAKRDPARLQNAVADTDFETLKADAAQLVRLRGGRTAAHGVEQLLLAVNKGLRERLA